MRPIQRRTFLQGTGAAAVATLGFPYIARGQDKSLVVNSYGGSFEEFMRGEIIPPFEEQTGITINLDVGLGKGWLLEKMLRCARACAQPVWGSLLCA